MTEQPKPTKCTSCGVELPQDDTAVDEFCDVCRHNEDRKEFFKKQRAFTQQEKEREKTIPLEHINNIENPELIGKNVSVEAVLSSTSVAYTVPSGGRAIIKAEDDSAFPILWEIEKKDTGNVSLVGIPSEIKTNRLKAVINRTHNAKVTQLEELKYRTVYMVRVRPPVFTLEKQGNKLVDEKGYEYKSIDIYVASDSQIVFQPSTLIKIEGVPLPHPRTQKTTLLAYGVSFPEDFQNFSREKLDELKAKLANRSVSERFDWVLDNFEIYSHIHGRRNLAKATLLAFHSPQWISIGSEEQKGWANVSIIGDTTTGKSETVRKTIKLLKAGTLISAETASIVGLTGTATQLEKDGWFIDWGFLPLMDRKLLAIDGAQKLSPGSWAALAEAERSGVLSITKAAKNSTYARTRQIRIYNAVDHQDDHYSTKSIASFLYPCLALATVLDKTSISRTDLAVFADQRDVTPEIINQPETGQYDTALEYLAENIKFVWGNTAKIEWAENAVATLLQKATELSNIFSNENIPLVVIDEKWKLARLSVALAYLTLSTNEDYSVVKVTSEHVEAIYNFIMDEYSKAGLNILAQEAKIETLTIEDVRDLYSRIETQLKDPIDKLHEVLRFIVLQGRVTKEQLKQKFILSENNQIRPLLAVLKNEGLLKTGKGTYPTPKLIDAYRVTDGFIVFNTFNTLKKEPPPPNPVERTINQTQSSLKSGLIGGRESYFEHDKQDKHDNNSVPLAPKLLKSGIVATVTAEKNCGQCGLWHKSACVTSGDPSCVTPTATDALDCQGFKPFATVEQPSSEDKCGPKSLDTEGDG